MFKDRKEAGQILSDYLGKYKSDPEAIVVAIPRGGVVPGNEIAKKLNVPLDLVLVKKIGYPGNKEFAIGAASLNTYLITHEGSASEEYINEEVTRLRMIMQGQYQKFFGEEKPVNLKGKKVIVVDDGAATGTTLIMVIELVKKSNPKEIIVAIPVAPIETVERIEQMVTKLICLETPYDFNAVGEVYENFEQVEDEEVAQILKARKK